MKRLSLLLAAALLASCGGGGTQTAIPKTTGSGTQGVTLTIAFPAKNPSSVKRGVRHPDYLPLGAAGIGIDYGPNPMSYSNTPNTTPVYAQAIALNSTAAPGCPAAANADGSFTCTMYLSNVPVGYDDFRVTIWNAAPSGCTNPSEFGGGCTFGSATALSTTVVPFQAVKQGQNNIFTFGFSSTVDSIYVTLNNGIVDGQATGTVPVPDLTAYVVEKDPQGQVILNSSQFLDNSGAPLTITLGISNNGSNSLSFTSPHTFNNVGATGNTATVHYDGSYQFASSGALQPAITVSLGASSINGTVLNARVGVTQSNAGGIGSGGAPQVAAVTSGSAGHHLTGTTSGNIALGSDGNLWIPEGNTIAQVTTAGAVTETAESGGHYVTAIAGLGDGAMWYYGCPTNFASCNGGPAYLYRFTPPNAASAAQSGHVIPPNACCGGLVKNFAMGGDGVVYFSEQDADGVDYVAPNSFSSTNSMGSAAMALGPGSYETLNVIAGPAFPSSHPGVCAIQINFGATLAYLECADTTAETFSTDVALTNLPNVVDANGQELAYMALGADGRVYVGENGLVEGFALSAGALSNVFSQPISGTVTGMTAGNDGNVWFTESNGDIGKIAVGSSSATLQEYAPAVTGSGSTAPFSLITAPAPSTKLYFYDSGNNNVYSITP